MNINGSIFGEFEDALDEHFANVEKFKELERVDNSKQFTQILRDIFSKYNLKIVERCKDVKEDKWYMVLDCTFHDDPLIIRFGFFRKTNRHENGIKDANIVITPDIFGGRLIIQGAYKKTLRGYIQNQSYRLKGMLSNYNIFVYEVPKELLWLREMLVERFR